jgi:hypothetical protein
MRRLHRAPGRNEEPPNDRPARRHNRARDAGRDVGDSVRILQELITENPRSEWCQRGHVEEAHNRRSAQQGLRAVQVRQVPAGLTKAATRSRPDAPEVRQLPRQVAVHSRACHLRLACRFRGRHGSHQRAAAPGAAASLRRLARTAVREPGRPRLLSVPAISPSWSSPP